MRTRYLDQDEAMILALYREPTLRETVRNIRQILNMSTVEEEMTELLRRTLEDLTEMTEEEFRARALPDPEDFAVPEDFFAGSEA